VDFSLLKEEDEPNHMNIVALTSKRGCEYKAVRKLLKTGEKLLGVRIKESQLQRVPNLL